MGNSRGLTVDRGGCWASIAARTSHLFELPVQLLQTTVLLLCSTMVWQFLFERSYALLFLSQSPENAFPSLSLSQNLCGPTKEEDRSFKTIICSQGISTEEEKFAIPLPRRMYKSNVNVPMLSMDVLLKKKPFVVIILPALSTIWRFLEHHRVRLWWSYPSLLRQ